MYSPVLHSRFKPNLQNFEASGTFWGLKMYHVSILRYFSFSESFFVQPRLCASHNRSITSLYSKLVLCSFMSSMVNAQKIFPRLRAHTDFNISILDLFYGDRVWWVAITCNFSVDKLYVIMFLLKSKNFKSKRKW